MRFEGTFTAVITPMTPDGHVDYQGLEQNIIRQIEGGIDGVVVLGTTGEVSTLLPEERRKIIECALETTKGAISVLAGCGTNDTSTTVKNVKEASSMGAAGVMIVTPYYNCPTQEGMYRHFMSAAEASTVPVMLYNIPKRCGRPVKAETLERLLAADAVQCIKDSSGDIDAIQEALNVVARFPRARYLSGDDNLTLPIMSLGGNGVVSVLSNVVPEWIAAKVKAARLGDFTTALQWHNKLLPLIKAAFIETNPIPVKAMMDLCGFAGGPCRLPLCELSSRNAAEVKGILETLGLLKDGAGVYASQS